jgi:regulator of RNase E activity RraA
MTDSRTIGERLRAVDTANLADVLDDLGLRDQGLSPELRPVVGERVAGKAYTICGQMLPESARAESATGDPRKMTACHGIGPGEVAVWSGDGEGVCYFGELIALGMKERGAVGALVDGGVRDTRALAGIGFPVAARYRSSVQSIGRWRVTAYQVPVYLRGATQRRVAVLPGDYVAADDDGAVVIPQARLAEVIERAEAMTAAEGQIRDALSAGLSLSAALEKFGHV